MNVAGLFVTGLGVANFYPLTVGSAMSVLPHGVDRALVRLQISAGGALLLMPLLVGILSDAVGMKSGMGVIVPTLLLALLLAGFVDRAIQGTLDSNAASRSLEG